MNRRILPVILIIAGIVGAVTVFMDTVTAQQVPRLSAYFFPLGWIAFGFLLFALYRTMTAKDDLIAAKQAMNDRLAEQTRDKQVTIENLERQVSGMQDQLRSAQHAHSMVSLDLANQKLFVRRLNGICKDNGIDTTAANIPPAQAGGVLNSVRVARENPVPPPPVPESLRSQVVSQRRSMSSPNPSSSPVIRDTDNGGFDGLMAGVMIGSMMSDSPPARAEPTPSRCEPTPTYSEPSRSESSYSEPTRSSGGDSWGGSSNSGSDSSSGDSGGGGGSCD